MTFDEWWAASKNDLRYEWPVGDVAEDAWNAAIAAEREAQEQKIANLEGTISTMCTWLEIHKPEVFKDGLWDAIRARGEK